jgi:hypothetical protein
MNTTITPLPWDINQVDENQFEVRGLNGHVVCQFDLGGIPEERGGAFYAACAREETENAEYICKAANFYPQLVEALKEAIREISRPSDWNTKIKLVNDFEALLSTLEESK